MKLQKDLISRINLLKKLDITGEVWDQICFLHGLIPFSPRKVTKKSSKIFFPRKALKDMEKNEFLKKIKQIKAWKNFINKSRKDGLKSYKIEKSLFFPFYRFEIVLKKRFPDFFKIFKKIDEIFFFFVSFEKISIYCSVSQKVIVNPDLLFKFFLLIKNLGFLNCFHESNEFFGLEMCIFNENYKINIPKENFFFQKKKQKTKIIFSFLELNLSLFNLVVIKMEKLRKDINFHFFSNKKKSEELRPFCFQPNFFILKKNNTLKNQRILKKNFKKMINVKKNRKLYNRKNFIFSKKNKILLNNSIFEGYCFFLDNVVKKNPFLEFDFFIKLINTRLKNNEKIIGTISDSIAAFKSIISLTINSFFVSFSFNSKKIIPLKIFEESKPSLKKLNPFFFKFQKGRKFDATKFRNKVKDKKFWSKEKNCEKKGFVLFLQDLNTQNEICKSDYTKKAFQCIGHIFINHENLQRF